MKPIIFTIPGIGWEIPGYGLALMLGFFISIWWAARRAMKSRANPDVILNLGFIAIIAGVVGCRGMYVIHYWDTFKVQGNLLQIAWAIIDVRKGGLEFYGGFIFTVVCVLAWLRFREKVSLRWYMDIVAPSAALGLAIGRIGCFLNGCCFGGTCDLPWAVRFPFGSNACMHQWTKHLPGAEIREELLRSERVSGVAIPLPRDLLQVSDEKLDALTETYRETLTLRATLAGSGDAAEKQSARARMDELNRSVGKDLNKYGSICDNLVKYGLTAAELRALAESHRSLPVHPTQLYSTVTALLIALILDALYWRRTRDGQVICTLLLIEPVSRWMLEVIRADNPIDTIGVFTISQFLAVCMTLLGLIGLLVLQRMPARSRRAVPWEPPEEESREKPGKRESAATGG